MKNPLNLEPKKKGHHEMGHEAHLMYMSSNTMQIKKKQCKIGYKTL
jgi:hypothetical protein